MLKWLIWGIVVDDHHQDVDKHQDPVDGEVEAEEDVRDEKLSYWASQTVAADDGMKKPSHTF